ncbi:secretin N-terminal domain-containing protein [Pseudoduganella violacea]|uniref:General secretion pathway protein D n=1 Tax=Pseudoduganella violacea TaxID=1715466 RepID=A0A7W5BAN3_9BURK|nr:secretin N-terminal domain-containing protein [Pseudoduganella violacea]MBB3119638.1 general secretion pathway protein D [Pseudoduganella violacea]
MPSQPHGPARLVQKITLSALLLALSGCAGQMAYRDAQGLIEKDQVEAGLAKLQEAMRREPGNAEYRSAYLNTRDRTLLRYLDLADQQMEEGKLDLAQQNIERALAVSPQNERARGGLRKLEMVERHGKLLLGASVLIEQREYDQAKQKLNQVLAERPQHERARDMLRDIAEKNPPAPAETGLAKVYKQPITIEFREAPIKQVFEVISRRSGLNFIFDKDVKTDTRTSIFLKNSTVESAIYYLLMTNQLEQQVMDGNTILIYPNIAPKLKEYQEMVIKTFYLANAEAKTIGNTLKTILKSRDVVIDEKLNLVIVRDNAEAIRLAEKLVAAQDIAEPEVMLDVEILEVKRTRLMDLGIDWPAKAVFTPINSKNGTDGFNLRDFDNLNRDRIGVNGTLPVTVKANKNDGDSNLLANPRIRVRNKEKAKVMIGDKLPVITSTISSGVGGFNTDSVSFVDVGVTLNAEPIIYLNNEVAIRVSLEVSNLVNTVITKNGTTAYQIGSRQASTLLQLKDGETQVLAGLLNNEERSSASKVPGLGDFPLLGRLFGASHDDTQKTEIVLSITPHLLRNVQRPEASISEFAAGTEANFRRKPDFSPRPPAQLPAPAAAQRAPQPATPATGAVPQTVAMPPPPVSNMPLSNTQPGPATSVAQPPLPSLSLPPPPPEAQPTPQNPPPQPQ